MTSIAAEGLAVALGGKAILHDVSIDVGAGRLIGILGANGAGKSTLVRALIGYLRPQRGRVLLDARPLASYGRRERARRLGYVAQGHAVHWPLAVRQVVELGRTAYRSGFGGLGAADRQAVDEAMKFVGVDGLAERPCDTLSGGERARVLIARALAGQPELLLADEPLSGLDPAYQLILMNLLRELTRRGTGVAVVMHDIALASRYCDAIVLMAQGRVIKAGAPEQVLQPAPLLRAYGIDVQSFSVEGETIVVPWHVVADTAATV